MQIWIPAQNFVNLGKVNVQFLSECENAKFCECSQNHIL